MHLSLANVSFFTSVLVLRGSKPARLLGGHSATKPPTPEIQALATEVKPSVEAELSKTFEKFEVTHFTQQVVAGMVYQLRIVTDDTEEDNKCLHIKVYKPLPHTGLPLELQAVKVADATDQL